MKYHTLCLWQTLTRRAGKRKAWKSCNLFSRIDITAQGSGAALFPCTVSTSLQRHATPVGSRLAARRLSRWVTRGPWAAPSLSNKGQLFTQLQLRPGLFQGGGVPLERVLDPPLQCKRVAFAARSRARLREPDVVVFEGEGGASPAAIMRLALNCLLQGTRLTYFHVNNLPNQTNDCSAKRLFFKQLSQTIIPSTFSAL